MIDPRKSTTKQSGEEKEMGNVKRKWGDMDDRMTSYNINLGQTREN